VQVPEGISRQGSEAERLYRAHTGALICPRAALGDAVLEGHYVEVKKASSTTINQVRAVKYIPLVIYRPDPESWYVVPAHEVVRLVALKTRGQHSENPFESATLSTNALEEFRTAPTELRERTLDAVRESENRTDLREAMDEVLRDCRELADESLARVRLLLP
jgi:hypothetical protein